MRPESLDRIEEAVAEAERNTSCEFVVVLAPASARYEGRVFTLAAAIAVIVFVLAHYANQHLLYTASDPPLLLLEALIAGGVTGALFARVGMLKRLIVPAWQRSARVDIAAAATFTQEKVSLTAERNAALLFVSVLEGEVRLMPDIGLARKTQEARLGEILSGLAHAQSGDPVGLIENALRDLGKCCGEGFPRAENDSNELPDKPQIRLP